MPCNYLQAGLVWPWFVEILRNVPSREFAEVAPAMRTCSRAWRHKRQTTKNQDGLGAVLILRAENETRTRDPDLGKVVLYQLSYFRRSRLESP